jgi:4-methylaminobutanoate oxidase (formaldehyde-forming)
VLVNCAGQWARQFGQLAGVTVPLYSAEHFYVVTERIDGVTPDLPVIRDPDGFIYYKEEVGGLVMGGFEPVAKPWNVAPIPADFAFQLLPEDWDQFEVLMRNAIHRTPCLETAPIKMLLNGPESFTLDGNFLLGEAPNVDGFFVCAGFNSAGIANAGGAGKLIAQWIVDGEAPVDLWDVDVRRFAGFHANRRHLAHRTVETLGLHYAMRWPREELATVRPLRRSPLYDRLKAAGAVFGSKLGWERANYFLPSRAHEPPPTLGAPGWLPFVLDEQRTCREAAVVFDQTSFAKFVVKGGDAVTVMQRLCANDVDVAPGRIVYTAMLNRRGGIESDLTVMRVAVDEYFVVSGSGQATRDFAWIERQIDERERAAIVDVTGAWSVLSLMGPAAEAVLARLSDDDFSRAAIPFSTARDVDVGYARVRAARMSYVGGPGFELYVPVEQCMTLYDALREGGSSLGLRDAGYYTIDALRIEAGRRAWGAELSPDETPFEAGLGFAVKLDKPIAFIGRDALREQVAQPLKRRLVTLTFDDPAAFPWGGEPLHVQGEPVGEITSAGYSWKLGRAIAMAYVPARALQPLAVAGACAVELNGAMTPVTVRP